MSCSDCRTRISEALDSSLPEAGAASLQGHLSGCAPCRRFDSEQRQLALLLQKADPDLEPPTRIWEQIERRIQAQSQAARPRLGAPGRLRDLFRLPQWGYAMAGLMLAAALSVTVFQWNNSDHFEEMLAELDAYQPEVRRNPWLAKSGGSNPFLQVVHDRSRNPFGDFRSEK